MISSSIWNRIGHPKLLVVGDLILDRYVSGPCRRLSPEAAVPVLQAEVTEDRLGGAAAVGNLAQGLGGRVILAGIVGEDSEGAALRALGEKSSIDLSLILVDPDRPTTIKERFFTRTGHSSIQHHLRVDRERTDAITALVEAELLSQIRLQLGSVDAVLLSDYGKGVLTPSLVQGVIEMAQERGLPVLIDPARSCGFAKYRGATVITPNRVEAAGATGFSSIEQRNVILAGRLLRKQVQLSSVLITLDKDGLALVTEDLETIAATRPRNVRDVAGAGDMVLAVAGIGLARGLAWPEILKLANTAAGLEVECEGVMPISRQAIDCELCEEPGIQTSKIRSLSEAVAFAREVRQEGKRIVFTNGCFDLFHAGHLHTLEEAAKLGDVLIVAINSDSSVRHLKGPMRPINSQENRAKVLAALECIDLVLIFAEATPHALLQALRPDVLVKGGTSTEIVGREIVEGYGGSVRQVGQFGNLSTTRLIEQFRLVAAEERH